MHDPSLPVDQILAGDCLAILETLPEKSIDLVFADPPYNLQLHQELWRPNLTRVDAVDEAWDRFSDFDAYDVFTRGWLSACRRALKDDGTLWVIGTYHNIFRIGRILQDLGFWILNDVVWIKTNPMPNFRGVRFTNAHETLIWASKTRRARYPFNHHAMKAANQGKQMRSDWLLPVCSGAERLKINGKKVHPTQKPEALLERVIRAASQPGDIVLDPFFGTGTTGAVARRLHRRWIGIEQDPEYVRIAQERIAAVEPHPNPAALFAARDELRNAPRIPFASLLEAGLVAPGQALYFRRDESCPAVICPDGRLALPGFQGSIHQSARRLLGGKPGNGWDLWYFREMDGSLRPIDELRQALRNPDKIDQR
jgi:modification methylase